MVWGRTLLQAGLASSAVALAAAGASAQGLNTPVQGTLGLVTSLDSNTNSNLSAVSPGTTFTASERISLKLLAETSAQKFQLDVGSSLDFTKSPGGGTTTDFKQPTFNASYFRESANSNLSFSARYNKVDVSSSYDSDPTDATNIIVDSGTLTRTGGTATLNTGLQAPLGFTVNLSYDDRNYAGTTNPLLFDTTTTSAGVTANLRFSGATTGQVGVTKTHYAAGDATNTKKDTWHYAFSVTQQMRSGLSVTGNLGYQAQTTHAGGPATKQNGILAGVSMNQPLPDGSVFGSLSFDGSGSADKTTVSVGRSFDLRAATLSASVSANKTVGTRPQFLGNVNYDRQLSDGTFNVSLNQSISTNNLDQDVKYTNLGIGFAKQINANDGFDLSLGLARSEDGGVGSAPTTNRATLTAAYNKALTPDWGLRFGYTHKTYRQAGSPQADSDALFLTLTRNIQFGF